MSPPPNSSFLICHERVYCAQPSKSLGNLFAFALHHSWPTEVMRRAQGCYRVFGGSANREATCYSIIIIVLLGFPRLLHFWRVCFYFGRCLPLELSGFEFCFWWARCDRRTYWGVTRESNNDVKLTSTSKQNDILIAIPPECTYFMIVVCMLWAIIASWASIQISPAPVFVLRPTSR